MVFTLQDYLNVTPVNKLLWNLYCSTDTKEEDLKYLLHVNEKLLLVEKDDNLVVKTDDGITRFIVRNSSSRNDNTTVTGIGNVTSSKGNIAYGGSIGDVFL